MAAVAQKYMRALGSLCEMLARTGTVQAAVDAVRFLLGTPAARPLSLLQPRNRTRSSYARHLVDHASEAEEGAEAAVGLLSFCNTLLLRASSHTAQFRKLLVDCPLASKVRAVGSPLWWMRQQDTGAN